ncbi:hypothetical protein HRbin10_02227 [bacterium HR10]|nr:hypothetical protein HRbin10_02227 [bacterium HR10]
MSTFWRAPLDQRSKPLKLAAVVVASAGLIRWADVHFGYTWVRESFPPSSGVLPVVVAELAALLWYVLPVAGVVCLLHGRERVWRELGLRGNVGRAVGYAMAFSSPMLLGYAWAGRAVEISAVPLLVLAQFRAAFREEVFYRAFLFGQLFRHGRWGLVPAVGLNALVFAFGHLSQASTPLQGAAIFAVTFVGAVWFAWLFVAWQYEVWLPVGLHFFMNLWWELFRIDETAFSGSLGAEVVRVLTVGASVAWTVGMVRRRGGVALPPGSLWWQRMREVRPDVGS